MKKHKILVLGCSGMLGHTLFHDLLINWGYDVKGTVRHIDNVTNFFFDDLLERVIPNVDAFEPETVKRVINDFSPDVVINCIGMIKQQPAAADPLKVITLNALFPHQLASFCKEFSCRLIQPSTDCVFDGSKGAYSELDKMTAEDLYGISKFMGEVHYDHTLTLRTSIIGHELNSNLSLVEWFLSQQVSVCGFTKAIYTGFPTIEISRILAEYVIPDTSLSGLFQVSSEPISKYNLIMLVKKIYGKNIQIEPFDGFTDDKSLISKRFREKTGYIPPPWEQLVQKMYVHFRQFGYNRKI